MIDKVILIARSPDTTTTGEIAVEMIYGELRYWLTEVNDDGLRHPARTLLGLHPSIHAAKNKWWRDWGRGWRWVETA